MSTVCQEMKKSVMYTYITDVINVHLAVLFYMGTQCKDLFILIKIS